VRRQVVHFRNEADRDSPFFSAHRLNLSHEDDGIGDLQLARHLVTEEPQESLSVELPRAAAAGGGREAKEGAE
jgi:hypothetical protein